MSLIYFILMLGLIVLVHEFGHFIFAKIFNVYVHEFSIGMGPLIKSWKGKETEYSLRWIPIGGYCALAGEEEGSSQDKKIPKDRLLNRKPIWQRFLIMVFGAMNNFILGFIIIFFIGCVFGAQNMNPVLSEVKENSPAEVAGLSVGDKILKINKDKITNTDDLSIYLQLADLSKPVDFTVKKENGEVKTCTVEADLEELEDGTQVYKVGISIDASVSHKLGKILEYTGKKWWSMFNQVFISLKALFQGRVTVKDFSGPVGIYRVVDSASKSETAVYSVLMLMALITVNVGFVKLLPLPAMDGGRIFLLLVELIIRKPINPKAESIINTVGFILLIGLMILITIKDLFIK